MSERILREGRNVWCQPHAQRVAALIDGESYFEALADAIERAERSIVMLGWDFHSRVRLRRNGDAEESELVALLERRVRQRRKLRVHILAWDFAMIYAAEREWLPLYRFGFRTHRRIRYRLDGQHPFGGSQHQKIVVIDDALAFCGGLDVTACRWDTREHRDGDPRRSDPGFPDYAPFHDVQLAVDGDAAKALAELAHERWQLAAGRRIRPVRVKGDPWPPGLRPSLRDVDVGISRTLPAYGERGEVREVEALYLDSIRAAERCIYLENQYLTSHAIGDALSERLAEAEGPEVVIVLPASLSGWLEENTMGVLIARNARRLRDADRHGRLRVLEPRLPGGARLTIHAKVAIIDDRLLRIGSANLANRSMGLDSECDLSIESTPERDCSREILRLRDDLVAEHLGLPREQVEDAVRRTGSLAAAIDALAGGERTLVPVDPKPSGLVEEWVSDAAVFDPERPVAIEQLRGLFENPGTAGEDSPPPQPWRVGLGIGVVAALIAIWTWSPLGESISPEALSRSVAGLGDTLGGGVTAVGLFALAALLMVPVTALIASCGLLFGPLLGGAIALCGSLLAAGIGYATGRLLWRDAVRRISGSRLDAVNRHLAERGLVAVTGIRLVPVAPFGVINLIAGASHVRVRDFLLGTLLGMGPGTLGLVLFSDRAWAAMQDPDPGSALVAVAVLIVLVLGALWARRRFGSDDPS